MVGTVTGEKGQSSPENLAAERSWHMMADYHEAVQLATEKQSLAHSRMSEAKLLTADYTAVCAVQLSEIDDFHTGSGFTRRGALIYMFGPSRIALHSGRIRSRFCSRKLRQMS